MTVWLHVLQSTWVRHKSKTIYLSKWHRIGNIHISYHWSEVAIHPVGRSLSWRSTEQQLLFSWRWRWAQRKDLPAPARDETCTGQWAHLWQPLCLPSAAARCPAGPGKQCKDCTFIPKKWSIVEGRVNHVTPAESPEGWVPELDLKGWCYDAERESVINQQKQSIG